MSDLLTVDRPEPGGHATGLTGRLSVRVLDTAEALDGADWRRIGRGCGFYSSWRWLRSLEDEPTHDVWYLAARDDAGVVHAVLPVYLATGPAVVGADSYYDPATVFFADDPAAATRWRPTLLVGSRAGYDTELIIDPALPPADRRTVLAALIARLHKLTDAWGVPTCAALYLPRAAADELAAELATRPVPTDATTVLDLRGVTRVEEYLSRLSPHRRARVRKEMREFAASGLGLRWVRLSEAAEAIAPLLAAHHRRYGHADPADVLAAHLRRQAAHLDDLSHVLLCQDGHQLLGAVLTYEWDGSWYARLVAAGDGLRGPSSAFFSLLFYAPVRAAIEHGASRYVLGPSSVGTKTNRGAVAEPRWSVLSGRGAAALDVQRLAAGHDRPAPAA